MSGMGVDIRVPSGWVVESAVVEGKKCIGTHSGSCKYRVRVLFSGKIRNAPALFKYGVRVLFSEGRSEFW